jgi:hypothetical protein
MRQYWKGQSTILSSESSLGIDISKAEAATRVITTSTVAYLQRRMRCGVVYDGLILYRPNFYLIFLYIVTC